MRTGLVLVAQRMALAQREGGADFELVAHTDRGSRCTGDADDNAMAESFVDT